MGNCGWLSAETVRNTTCKSLLSQSSLVLGTTHAYHNDCVCECMTRLENRTAPATSTTLLTRPTPFDMFARSLCPRPGLLEESPKSYTSDGVSTRFHLWLKAVISKPRPPSGTLVWNRTSWVFGCPGRCLSVVCAVIVLRRLPKHRAHVLHRIALQALWRSLPSGLKFCRLFGRRLVVCSLTLGCRLRCWSSLLFGTAIPSSAFMFVSAR